VFVYKCDSETMTKKSVLKAWRHHTSVNLSCAGCPYYQKKESGCVSDLVMDTVRLGLIPGLKENKPEKVTDNRDI
jgi:hypothetical protein